MSAILPRHQIEVRGSALRGIRDGSYTIILYKPISPETCGKILHGDKLSRPYSYAVFGTDYGHEIRRKDRSRPAQEQYWETVASVIKA